MYRKPVNLRRGSVEKPLNVRPITKRRQIVERLSMYWILVALMTCLTLPSIHAKFIDLGYRPDDIDNAIRYTKEVKGKAALTDRSKHIN